MKGSDTDLEDVFREERRRMRDIENRVKTMECMQVYGRAIWHLFGGCCGDYEIENEVDAELQCFAGDSWRTRDLFHSLIIYWARIK